MNSALFRVIEAARGAAGFARDDGQEEQVSKLETFLALMPSPQRDDEGDHGALLSLRSRAAKRAMDMTHEPRSSAPVRPARPV